MSRDYGEAVVGAVGAMLIKKGASKSGVTAASRSGGSRTLHGKIIALRRWLEQEHAALELHEWTPHLGIGLPMYNENWSTMPLRNETWPSEWSESWQRFHTEWVQPILDEQTSKKRKTDSEAGPSAFAGFDDLMEQVPDADDTWFLGDLHVAGHVHAKGIRLEGADNAELFWPREPGAQVCPRQVVGIHGAPPHPRGPLFSLCTRDALFVGVVSMAPAVCANMPSSDPHDGAHDGALPIVLAGWSGQLHVLVAGAVAIGDILTPSGRNDGYAAARARSDVSTSTPIGVVARKGAVMSIGSVEVAPSLGSSSDQPVCSCLVIMGAEASDGIMQELQRTIQELRLELHSVKCQVETMRADQARCIPGQLIDSACDHDGTTGLYVSAFSAAASLEWLHERGITHVVNATTDRPCVHPAHVTYLRVEVEDRVEVPISDFFASVNDFVANARAAGGSVLIHCSKGRSRSPTLAIAYLMSEQAINLQTAFAQLTSARPNTAINSGFCQELQEYELKVQLDRLELARSDIIAVAVLCVFDLSVFDLRTWLRLLRVSHSFRIVVRQSMRRAQAPHHDPNPNRTRDDPPTSRLAAMRRPVIATRPLLFHSLDPSLGPRLNPILSADQQNELLRVIDFAWLARELSSPTATRRSFASLQIPDTLKARGLLSSVIQLPITSLTLYLVDAGNKGDFSRSPNFSPAYSPARTLSLRGANLVIPSDRPNLRVLILGRLCRTYVESISVEACTGLRTLECIDRTKPGDRYTPIRMTVCPSLRTLAMQSSDEVTNLTAAEQLSSLHIRSCVGGHRRVILAGRRADDLSTLVRLNAKLRVLHLRNIGCHGQPITNGAVPLDGVLDALNGSAAQSARGNQQPFLHTFVLNRCLIGAPRDVPHLGKLRTLIFIRQGAEGWNEVLRQASHIYTLRFEHMALSNFGPHTLEPCIRLRTLSILNCAISDLSSIEHCRTLEMLRLKVCPNLVEISSLAACSSLHTVYFGSCGIESLAALSQCAKLRTLSLVGCRNLADTSALRRCRVLRTLSIIGHRHFICNDLCEMGGFLHSLLVSHSPEAVPQRPGVKAALVAALPHVHLAGDAFSFT